MRNKDVDPRPYKRIRLTPEQREAEIVEGAIQYFAEVGFNGNVRELAARLGISHALLFRYFPTKEALVERVYDQLYLRRWKPHWDEFLSDGDVALELRLVRFYKEYLKAIYRPEWVRTFVFGGLNGETINRRYLKLIKRKVIVPIALDLQLLSGVTNNKNAPPSDDALELSWGLHGEIYYLAIRRWVYGVRVTSDLERFVELTVAKFIDGAPVALKNVSKNH